MNQTGLGNGLPGLGEVRLMEIILEVDADESGKGLLRDDEVPPHRYQVAAG